MMHRYEETDIRSLKKHEPFYPDYLFAFLRREVIFLQRSDKKNPQMGKENIRMPKCTGMREVQLPHPIFVESPLKCCSTIIRSHLIRISHPGASEREAGTQILRRYMTWTQNLLYQSNAQLSSTGRLTFALMPDR